MCKIPSFPHVKTTISDELFTRVPGPRDRIHKPFHTEKSYSFGIHVAFPGPHVVVGGYLAQLVCSLGVPSEVFDQAC